MLPIFCGKEKHGTVYKDMCHGDAAREQLIGFNSIWGCVKADPSGAQVGLNGIPQPGQEDKKDECGFFWRKPLPQQEKIFEGLFKNNAAEGMPPRACAR